MVGFANFTHQYDYRLGETPFYRRGAMGKDPLKTFSTQSTQAYRANASRIRDMRFANSNELNADIALRSKREQMISDIYSGKRNPELLIGVHGKLNPQYTRSGGALSTGRPKVRFEKFKSRSDSPVAPEAETVPASHTTPSATSGFSTPPTRSQPKPPTTPKPPSRVIQQILYLAANKEYTKVQSKLSTLQQTNKTAYKRAMQALQRGGYRFASGSGAKAVRQNSAQKRLEMT